MNGTNVETDEQAFRALCERFGLVVEKFDRRKREHPIAADAGMVPSVYRIHPDYNRMQDIRMEFTFGVDGKFVSSGCW